MSSELIPGVTKDQFESFISSLFEDAEKTLYEELCFTTTANLPNFRPFGIIDSQSNGTPGHSIAALPRGSLVRGGAYLDVKGNLKNSTKSSEVLSSASSNTWKKESIEGYEQTINKFLEYLLILILITGGQPDQGAQYDQMSELISLIHRNPSREELRAHPEREGVVRSIFLARGRITIVTADHHSAEGIRVRRLDTRGTRLLSIYLTSVRPFFQTLVPDSPLSISELLFETDDGLWSNEKYRGILLRESEAKMGKGLSIEDVNRIHGAARSS